MTFLKPKRQEFTTCSYSMPKDLVKALKSYAVQHNYAASSVVAQAVADFLTRVLNDGGANEEQAHAPR